MYDVNKQAEDQFKNKMERFLSLNGFVNDDTCPPLISKIIEINMKDDVYESLIPNYVREPIILVVDTIGGSCYDGQGVVSAILQSKTPVHTYCYSKAMSMGQQVFIAGHQRFMAKNATIMFHGVSTGSRGKLPDVELDLQEAQRLEKMAVDITVKRCKVSRETLQSYIDKKEDWYLDVDTAIEYGFATNSL